ncbi:MAG: hypothetical protein JXB39_05360 [Deltaproteobacteria bacterium]|nr:hypothetical protein [Deltaproteobacteria bacterium]
MLSLLFLSACAADPGIAPLLERWVTPEAQDALAAHFEGEAARLARRLGDVGPAGPDRVREAVARQVAANLSHKATLAIPPRLDADRLRRTVIDYEIFKLETYVRAGVFPKRYFGYLDLEGDTAEAERVLRDTVICATDGVNAWEAARGSPLRASDMDVAVTFLAEGGALLLASAATFRDALHPVIDVGLDDLASGLADLPGLVDRLDAACGTGLGSLVAWTSPDAPPPPGARGPLASAPSRAGWLTRDATFREAIVGTAALWIWEMDLAARKLEAEGRVPLPLRDRATRFVHTSLVYNSGILHAEDTVAAIVGLECGPTVWARSEAAALRPTPDTRPRLPVAPPDVLLAEILGGAPYREQPTSWLAAYHVAQRFGAWEALRRLTDGFDDEGRFRARLPAAENPP